MFILGAAHFDYSSLGLGSFPDFPPALFSFVDFWTGFLFWRLSERIYFCWQLSSASFWNFIISSSFFFFCVRLVPFFACSLSYVFIYLLSYVSQCMLRTAVPGPLIRWPEPIYMRVGHALNRVFRQERFNRFLWFLASLIKNSRTLRNCYLSSCRYKNLWDIGMRLKPHFLQKMSITLKPIQYNTTQ